MIRSRRDFLDYREADRIALRRQPSSQMMFDEVWKFQRLLRRVEYHLNCHKHMGLLGKLIYKYWSIRFHSQSIRCGFDIPPNVFGPGLSIAHRGTIVVHPDVRIGRNCRIHVDVVIGTRPGPDDQVPTLGDNCYIGPGAKLFGAIVIGDNTAIGANSVVNASFPDGFCTIAGAPARKVSDTPSTEYIIATRSHKKTLG